MSLEKTEKRRRSVKKKPRSRAIAGAISDRHHFGGTEKIRRRNRKNLDTFGLKVGPTVGQRGN